jgi:tetratricopeptide (TPR) repeat protein
MPLESPDRKHWEAARGYLELGMYDSANEELENIDPFNRAAPEVLALRVELYQRLQRWHLMREISRRLNEFDPNDVQWIISYAFATRRAVSIEVAKEILLKAVSKFPKEATILFNLACYECQLGQLDSAKEYLRRTFEIDRKWRIHALDDEDLKPLWDVIGKGLQ